MTMAGDWYNNNNQNMVEAMIWKACAGSSVNIPGVGSRVYYFPQGHMDHSSGPKSVPPRPFFICRLIQVLYLVDPDSDEVYARIRLEPDLFLLDQPPPPPPSPVTVSVSSVVSFAKVLTPSDANNGGGFSVPRFCADSIFPPLDYAADPPVQTLTMTDLREQTWKFRHIYRGTPRRHLLTTGWSKFVNSKKLIGGDSVVFMKNKVTGKLLVGVRRANKSNSSADLAKWASMYYGASSINITTKTKFGRKGPESVVEALNLAANNMPFEVVYYPKASTEDFVVAADRVDTAMRLNWRAEMRVKMPMETQDSSRLSWFQGTVSSVLLPDFVTSQSSPWRMLQVAWDDTEVLENMKKVSPWQVEFVPSTQAIDATFPPAKKPRLPQNCGFLTSVGEGEYPLPPPPPPPHMGFSDSMTGHPSSSYLNHNTFPAGMQGARQDTFGVSSSASVDTTHPCQSFPITHADNNLLEKTAAVSTDLNIGCSSQSELVSPDSSSSILSSSPDVNGRISRTSADKVVRTSIQLFGHTIHMDCPVGSPNHVGSGGGYVTNQESQVLLARIDVPFSETVPTVDQVCSLPLEK